MSWRGGHKSTSLYVNSWTLTHDICICSVTSTKSSPRKKNAGDVKRKLVKACMWQEGVSSRVRRGRGAAPAPAPALWAPAAAPAPHGSSHTPRGGLGCDWGFASAYFGLQPWTFQRFCDWLSMGQLPFPFQLVLFFSSSYDFFLFIIEDWEGYHVWVIYA